MPCYMRFRRARSGKNNNLVGSLLALKFLYPHIGSSSVIEFLRKKHCQQPDVGIACMYCDYRDQETQTILNMIGGLAKQLARQARSIPDAIWDIFKEKSTENRPINLEDAQMIFGHLLWTFDPAYVCIDALDECDSQLRRQLLESLKALAQSPLRVFLTSRQNVVSELGDALTIFRTKFIPIVAKEEDIRMYLSQRIAKDPYPDAMDKILEEEIIEKIVGLSHGT